MTSKVEHFYSTHLNMAIEKTDLMHEITLCDCFEKPPCLFLLQ